LKEGERIKGKQPCINCKSSDAVSIYQKPDGTFDGHCFSCESYITPNQVAEHYNIGEKEEEVSDFDPSSIMSLPMRGWRERRVGKEVTEMYGVRTELAECGTMIKRHYPVTEDGELVGYHTRDCLKKGFYTQGKNKTTSEFFGQSLFTSGNKFLVICGGEEDAMSLQQALKMKNPKFTTAVVSPTNGEASVAAQIKGNYEWVTGFEKVILMLDNDEPGRKATDEALKLLKPGQGYIAKLVLKDPNEYIKAKREDELVGAFWKAERYSPIELMTLGQMWDEFEASAQQSIIPFPSAFGQLNDMLGGGVGLGEVTVIGALTSIGKSTVINNLVYSFFKETEHRIGLLYLESTPREIVSHLLSIYMEDNIALKKPEDLDMPALKKEFMGMIKTDDRIVSINHQGAFSSMDDMFTKLEWMVKCMGTKVVVIDPLQASVPSNENALVEDFMDRVLKLAKQTDCCIFVVSHMRKPEGKDPHAVSEYDLKGTSAINQIAFNTILLSRDKTSESPKVRNSTRMQVVKCRRTGFTGEAGWLRFDPEKAKLSACSDPYKDEAEESDEELKEIYGE